MDKKEWDKKMADLQKGISEFADEVKELGAEIARLNAELNAWLYDIEHRVETPDE